MQSLEVFPHKFYFQNQHLEPKLDLSIEVYHPEAAAPNLKELKQKVSDKWSVPLDQVSLFHFRTQFGGGRSVGTCLLYDTKDLKMKIEPKYRLIRDGLVKKVVVPSRKAQKTLKTKLKKLHGKAVTTAKKGK